jgi:hypothetical protein
MVAAGTFRTPSQVNFSERRVFFASGVVNLIWLLEIFPLHSMESSAANTHVPMSTEMNSFF